jgi:transcriptional regulator with XRE-family HTH domain
LAAQHTIGGRILALRNDRGVQQQELAAALDISTSALRNIEHGDTLPRLSTLEVLSDYFNVSIDYLVRGVASGGNILSFYRDTGLNDLSLMFLTREIERGRECGGLNEYIAALNGLITNGLPNLVWGLKLLNEELVRLEAEIQKTQAETPRPDGIAEGSPEELLFDAQLSNQLEPLRERRDLLKLRYLRWVEKVFDNQSVKENE